MARPRGEAANTQPSVRAGTDAVWDSGMDACGMPMMAGNFEPATLTATRAVALKHYKLQCYSHVTTASANY